MMQSRRDLHVCLPEGTQFEHLISEEVQVASPQELPSEEVQFDECDEDAESKWQEPTEDPQRSRMLQPGSVQALSEQALRTSPDKSSDRGSEALNGQGRLLSTKDELCSINGLEMEPAEALRLLKLFVAQDSEVAAECLSQLRAQEKAEEKFEQAETIEDLKQDTDPGDESRLSCIAALLDPHSGQPHEVRLDAVHALKELVPTFRSNWPSLPRVLEHLRNAASRTKLGQDDDAVRKAALNALREVAPCGDTDSLNRCRSLLEGAVREPLESEEIRLAVADAVQGLAVRGDVCSLRAAIATMSDASSSVRTVGFGTLRRICGPRGACPGFLAQLGPLATGYPEAEVRAITLELISQVEEEGSEGGIAVAVAGLMDPEEEVQLAALSTLRRLWCRGAPGAVEALTNLAGSSRFERVRCVSLEALPCVAERGNNTAMLAAAKAFGDAEFSVQAAAAQVFKKLCSRGGDGEIVSTLLGYLDGRSEARRLAVEALGQAATKQDIPALGALAGLRDGRDGSDDVGLQLAAEQALRQIQG